MEELIKQAFVHVDVFGPHVQAGHYDLIGPNGEIILPAIWEQVIEPDWSVQMHMWPMEQRPPLAGQMGRGGAPPGMNGNPRIPLQHQHPGMPPHGAHRPGMGGPVPAGPPPPPNFPGGQIPIRPPQHPNGGPGGLPHGVNVVHAKPRKSSSKPKTGGTLGSFFMGKPPKSKK